MRNQRLEENAPMQPYDWNRLEQRPRVTLWTDRALEDDVYDHMRQS
jgi:hypothetical protein